MYSSETLLDPVRIPRQVVVDHKMSALEVNPFSGRVSGEKHLNLGIVQKRFLSFTTLFSPQSAMNDHEGFASAKERRDQRSDCAGS